MTPRKGSRDCHQPVPLCRRSVLLPTTASFGCSAPRLGVPACLGRWLFATVPSWYSREQRPEARTPARIDRLPAELSRGLGVGAPRTCVIIATLCWPTMAARPSSEPAAAARRGSRRGAPGATPKRASLHRPGAPAKIPRRIVHRELLEMESVNTVYETYLLLEHCGV
jgi:hypothetical protein